jgi:hypothetical protein
LEGNNSALVFPEKKGRLEEKGKMKNAKIASWSINYA